MSDFQRMRRRAKKGPGLAQRVAESVGRAPRHLPKPEPVYRNLQHRQNVANLPCAACRLENYSQAAHLNLAALGKGRGLKVSDALTVPLCCTRPGLIGCHVRLDSSGQYDKATAETLQLTWLHNTISQLKHLGQWSDEAQADVDRLVQAYMERSGT